MNTSQFTYYRPVRGKDHQRQVIVPSIDDAGISRGPGVPQGARSGLSETGLVERHADVQPVLVYRDRTPIITVALGEGSIASRGTDTELLCEESITFIVKHPQARLALA